MIKWQPDSRSTPAQSCNLPKGSHIPPVPCGCRGWVGGVNPFRDFAFHPPCGSGSKECRQLGFLQFPTMQEISIQSLGWVGPLERAWQPTPVFLPGESHKQKSLEGYSPYGHKESDMTKVTWHTINCKHCIKSFFKSPKNVL